MATSKKTSGKSKASRRRRSREQPPLEVRVTLDFRFGDEPDESVRMLNDRRVPMVGNVFEYRDRIARSFAMLLLRAGVTQPRVVGEILPAVRWAMRGRGKSRGD